MPDDREPAAPPDADADLVSLDDVELLGAAEWLARGRELYTAGALGDAAEAFAQAARLEPDAAEPLYLVAKALRRGDPTTARGLLERAVALRPEAFEAWRALALLCARAQDRVGVERALAGARAADERRGAALERELAGVVP
jgi:tetratricopeptide (TPR) repeat protein